MNRPILSASSYSSSINPWACPSLSARIVLPFGIWLIVWTSLRYGYYGNRQLVLGPNSSRLIKASSVFVERIQVRNAAERGLLLHGYLEKPELSMETNWSVSNYLSVEAYGRQGFFLWLNRGSKIHIAWRVQNRRAGDLLVVLIKGESNFETLIKNPTISHSKGFIEQIDGNGGAEYTVEEDDRYYVGAVNLQHRRSVMEMKVNLSSKMYDTAKAKEHCSTSGGVCKLKLSFPNTQYVVLATPNDDDGVAWYVELSFVGRLATYIGILVLLVLLTFLLFKYIGACDIESPAGAEAAPPEEAAADPETEPLLSPTKEASCLYGTNEEEEEEEECGEAGQRAASKDLYDGKICVICYDERRSCFFVPCGHCATCSACAQRIVDGENKTCPICRRIIYKVRKLHRP